MSIKSVIKNIYYGIPARYFELSKVTRKPTRLFIVGIIVVPFLLSVVLTAWIFFGHTLLPIKGLQVMFAFIAKWNCDLAKRPVPQSVEDMISASTPAERSVAGWLLLFVLADVALLIGASIWQRYLLHKHATKRDDEKERGDSDKSQGAHGG